MALQRAHVSVEAPLFRPRRCRPKRFTPKSATIAPILAALLFFSILARAADSGPDKLAKKLFAVTKTGSYAAYQRLFYPTCHARPFTSRSFELRSDLLRKMNPGARVEAMPLAAYQTMRKRKGAPPDRTTYAVPPSYIVIVRGSVPGVVGGDWVELGPITNSKHGWKLLEGDCLSNPRAKSKNPK